MNFNILNQTLIIAFIMNVGNLIAQSTPLLPADFYDEKIGSSWNRPLGITFDNKGQGYVWEKEGRVYIINSEGNKFNTPLIDISEEVMPWSDHGLVGFVLHPKFMENGYFYLYYSVDRHYLDFYGTPEYDPDLTIDHQATIARITRYTADVNFDFQSLVPNSRKIILGKNRADGAPILIGSHAAGSLVFGLDGSLLASIGDAGYYKYDDVGNAPAEESPWEQAIEEGILNPEDNVGQLKALQVQNLNGSILRIDPDTGHGIPSNPYYIAGQPNADQSKIWVTGLRNPYKFFRQTNTGSHKLEDGDPGTLFIGDVGGAGWEELNIAHTGGQCFGWPMYEGITENEGVYEQQIENTYLKNPLDCGKDYFTFHDLLKNNNSLVNPIFRNPCDEEVLIDQALTLVHSPPILTWTNKRWNSSTGTRVPVYNPNNGQLGFQNISNEEDAIFKGIEFTGSTSIPGFIYDRTEFPEFYHGKYFHADLSGWIRILTLDSEYNCTKVDSFAYWPDEGKGIVSLTLNPHDGAIYWCHVYDNEVHKITFGQDPKPIPVIKYDQQFGSSPLTVQLDGSDSYDPDGGPISHFWEFGDGETSNSISPIHEFVADNSNPQSFKVKLTVIDSIGQEGSKEMIISLNNTPPQVSISSISENATYPISGTTFVPLEAVVVDEEHQQEELEYSWQVSLQHNDHYHPEVPINKPSSIFTLDPIGCSDEEDYWYKVTLTVTDPQGLVGVDEKELFPYCEEDFVDIINLDGEKDVGPKIVLTWETSDQSEVVSYQIQKSNGTQFLSIGNLDKTEMNSYTFDDQSPNQGYNFYRICAYNKAGNFIYSNILRVDCNVADDMLAFPNPNSGLVKVFVPSAYEGFVDFRLFDAQGRLVYSHTWVHAAEMNITELNLDHLTLTGLYYYQVENKNNLKVGSLVFE